MQNLWIEITGTVGPYLPRVAAAVAVLVIGWIVSHVLATIVRKGLHRTDLDNRLAAWFAGEENAQRIDIEAATGRGVYYLAMLFVLVAVFQVLGLTIVTEPLNVLLSRIFNFAPRVLSAGLLIALAWVLATGLRAVVTRLVRTTSLEKRIREEAGEEQGGDTLAQTMGEALYWFIFLLFLPGILDALALEGMMAPVQGMLSQIIGFLPNLFTAAVTLAIGWLIARIVQRITSSFLAAVGLDALSERLGLAGALGGQRASRIVGIVVYVLIFIPILISALTALRLEAITTPLSNMLNTVLNSIPMVFAAILVLAVSYVVGRMVADLVTNLLTSIGFNAVLERLGLGKATGPEDARTPAAVVGSVVLMFILLFASMEAAGLLGFQSLRLVILEFLGVAGHVVFGIVLFGVGLFLANFVAQTIRSAGAPQAGLLSSLARIAILVLAGAIALRQMGLANEIVNLAFGLIVGAIAVAAAISFGIGGRDIAARQLDRWVQRIQS